MYTPAAFAESDRDTLLALMRGHSFAALVSQHDGDPFATHLPLLVEDGGRALVGHMARPNPQWRQAEGRTVLAIFAGPHAYVSPTWYEADRTAAGRVVPTWNYATVHAYGTFRTVEDEADAMAIVARTVETYEAAMPSPWRMTADGAFERQMMKGVVAFRIEVDRLEGKFKLSQNHPRERREKVVAALRISGDQDARAVAAMMGERLTSSMHESAFWLRMEYRIGAEMAGLRDPQFARFWCDGFDPDDGELRTEHGRRTVGGRCWTGQSGQEVWTFTLLLPPAATSRASIDWESLLPPADVTGWLKLDAARRHVTIDPAAAYPDHTQKA